MLSASPWQTLSKFHKLVYDNQTQSLYSIRHNALFQYSFTDTTWIPCKMDDQTQQFLDQGSERYFTESAVFNNNIYLIRNSLHLQSSIMISNITNDHQIQQIEQNFFYKTKTHFFQNLVKNLYLLLDSAKAGR